MTVRHVVGNNKIYNWCKINQDFKILKSGNEIIQTTIFTFSWNCDECGLSGQSGGSIAETAHKLTHSLQLANPIMRDVKTEDSGDG